MTPFFYTLNVLLLLTGLLGIRLKSGEQCFSLALVRILLTLPLLAGEYLYLAYDFAVETAQLVFLSEIVFALLWLSMAMNLRKVTVSVPIPQFRHRCLVENMIGIAVTSVAAYVLASRSAISVSDEMLTVPLYRPVFFSAFALLMIILYSSWRLEQFWRALNAARRREYKFLIVGSGMICAAMAWSSSYRLTYLAIAPRHLQLLTALLLFGWAMMSYAVVHHRLLNRKMFVSRKVVYSFVVPSLLAGYLLGFGLIALVIRTFGLEMSYVLQWLFIALGLVAIGLFACSGKIRRRVHYFISTHFYINKYEYRDEWLALSQHLHGALSEAEVVKALRDVLAESLYTTEIFIWVGDSSHGFKLVSSPEKHDSGSEMTLAVNDPLVEYLHSHSFFHGNEKETDSTWQQVADSKESFLISMNLRLFAPIAIGHQLVGLIGLGEEFTGGQYGHDDFDLLAALGNQTASALLAVRMAEKLAHVREQQAWNRLSAFVLHDIKNASTMLSLLRENAPEHIHEPEFQQDLLELIDDALRRMGRVEERLQTLKEEITPNLQDMQLAPFLKDFTRRLKPKLPALEITVKCPDPIAILTDPELLSSILENLLLNASQAEATAVQLYGARNENNRQMLLQIIDNGQGITEELLPELLFEPFKTSKEGGSGIGLWQVKRVIASLSGSVAAENNPESGARFVLRLPTTEGVG